MGVDVFGDRARAAGVDGVLVLDLPIEEAGGFRDAMAARDIDMIFLLSPTTTDARVKDAARLGRGFLYGISRLGVTGTRDTVADGAQALAARMRAATSLPDRPGLRHFVARARAADWQVRGRRGGRKRAGRMSSLRRERARI